MMMHARRRAMAVFVFVLVSSFLTAPSASADLVDCGAPVSQSSDKFSIAFWDFHVRAGGDSTPAEGRRTCLVSAVPVLDLPEGFTYAITAVELRGFADLATGATGSATWEYYFEGSQARRSNDESIRGPHSGGWMSTEQVPLEQLVWKPCGKDPVLHVKTGLRVGSGTADPSKVNAMDFDSDPSTYGITFRFAWKACPR
ncbi:MAG: DUF4360 domain-containing protein [Spirillospora sp.]